MKIFLSSLENNEAQIDILKPMHYNLISYYYGRNKQSRVDEIVRNSELVMIDSGAHSFQKGTKVKWNEYTEQYAAWIKANDRPNIVGYFEMDVDNVIGYDNVLKLRKVLERDSDKIIPVWHKNRGIDDYKRMCHEYSGRVIAITGFKNEDIQDHQYLMFLKYAWAHDCRVHCLGMTRKPVLDKVPFDYVDSSSWTQGVLYGRIGDRKLAYPKDMQERQEMRIRQWNEAYRQAMKMQEHYEAKWASTTRKMKEGLLKQSHE